MIIVSLPCNSMKIDVEHWVTVCGKCHAQNQRMGKFLQVDVLGSAGHCQWVWWALVGFCSHWGIVGRDNAGLHWNYSQSLIWGGGNGVFRRWCLAMLMQRVTHLEAPLIRCTFQICSDTIYIAMACHAANVNWNMTLPAQHSCTRHS